MLGATFLNIVTKDLPKARAFYEGLGLKPNPEFSNDQAASFTVNGSSHLHILTQEFMGQFTPRPISDVAAFVWGTFAIGVDSKQDVDAYAAKVLDLGGGEEKEAQDMGFMYGRTMRDLDGNIIEFFWMDPAQTPPA